MRGIRTRGLATIGVFLVVTALSAVLAPTAAAANDFTWSGATPTSTTGAANWSLGSNWVGGSAPSGSVGTLTFPALTSTACTANPPTDTCYQSNNDLSGVSANSVAIDDGHTWNMSGNPFTLGGGGLTAMTAATSPPGYGYGTQGWEITLGASQTWSVDGGPAGAGTLALTNVTGPSSDPLAIDLSHGGTVDVGPASGPNDVETGPMTVSGNGNVTLGGSPNGGSGSLNGTDGQPVTFTDGATLAVRGSETTGPLSVSGATIDFGSFYGLGILSAGALSVDGNAGLDSGSALSMWLNGSEGPSLLSATGNIELGGANLSLRVYSDPSFGNCGLRQGTVFTVAKTTGGTLHGTFAGLPDGATMPVDCDGPPQNPPVVRINYTSSAVTATVVDPGSMTTTTSLTSSSQSVHTNQQVVLTAATTSGDGNFYGASGTVEFSDQNGPIAGCASVPLSEPESNSEPVTAKCRTSFPASGSPVQITATFLPTHSGNGPYFASSTSNQVVLTVAKGPTATRLLVTTLARGRTHLARLTAIVNPATSGTTKVGGWVEFFDGATRIGGCNRGVRPDGSAAIATCTVKYRSRGRHRFTARYLGNANFDSSSSSPHIVTFVTARRR